MGEKIIKDDLGALGVRATAKDFFFFFFLHFVFPVPMVRQFSNFTIFFTRDVFFNRFRELLRILGTLLAYCAVEILSF